MKKSLRDSDLLVLVDYWKARLADCDDYPVLDSLKNQWEQIQQESHFYDWANLKQNPILTMFEMIDAGQYPPPEFLLAFHDALSDYLYGQFDQSPQPLEMALFGERVQRSGDFAKRYKDHGNQMLHRFRFAQLLHQGLRRIDAAEQVVNEFDLPIDAESLLKQFRGYKGFPIKKDEQSDDKT